MLSAFLISSATSTSEHSKIANCYQDGDLCTPCLVLTLCYV